MSFTLSSKNNPCPICEDTTAKCRQGKNDLDYWQCRPMSSVRVGEVINGWKAIKPTERGGEWMQFKRNNSAKYSDEQKREYQAERALERQIKAKRKEQQIASELPAVDRDRYYRNILSQLSLSQKHRDHLKNDRGMSDDQANNYKTAYKWQKVNGDFPANLPGVLPNNSLNVSGTGILCPTYNQDGLIVALRLRLDDSSQGKYRWLTSATQKNSDGATPHINGELPLAVLEPQETKGDYIAFTEGLEIKPFIACDRLVVPVLGAAGGQWLSSPNTAKKSVSYLSDKSNTKRIVLFPDAGDVVNTQVAAKWLKIYEFFTELGYSVEFAWWGQLLKDQSDIDELEDLSVIKFISLDGFNEQIRIANHVDQFITEQKQEEEKTNKVDEFFQNWIDFGGYTATPGCQYDSPNAKIAELNLPVKGLTNGFEKSIIGVRSPMGTGKTGAMGENIKVQRKGTRIISSLNHLLLQICNRAWEESGVKVRHLREDDAYQWVEVNYENIACCPDSLQHLDGHFEGRDIYLDEFMQTLKGMISGGTLKSRQDLIMSIFTRALNECDNIYLIDANLSDEFVNFIAQLCPDKRVIKTENIRKPPQQVIEIVDTVNDEGEVRIRDKSPIIQMILNPDTKSWVATDSKNQSNRLGEIFKGMVTDGILERYHIVNSETVGEDNSKRFMKNTDKFIREFQPQKIVHSPSAGVGVSCNERDYFDEKFGLLVGVQGTNEASQTLFRLRDNNVKLTLFCPEKSTMRELDNPRSYFFSKIMQELKDRFTLDMGICSYGDIQAEKVLSEVGRKIDEERYKVWFQFSIKLIGIDNYEKANYRKCLVHKLESYGHEIRYSQEETNQEVSKLEKDVKEKLLDDEAERIAKAVPFESLDEARAAGKKSPNKEMKAKIDLTFLVHRVPGIMESEVWGKDFVRDCYLKDKTFISGIEADYLVKNTDVRKRRHQKYWKDVVDNEHYSGISAKKSPHLKLWALSEINILGLINLGEKYSKDSPELIDLWNFVEGRKDIRKALKLETMTKKVDGGERLTLCSEILKMIGVKFKQVGRLNNEQGVRERYYSIDEDYLNLPERVAVMEGVKQQFKEWMEKESVKNLTWETEVKPPIRKQNQFQDRQEPVTIPEHKETLTATEVQPINTSQDDNLNWLEVTENQPVISEVDPINQDVVTQPQETDTTTWKGKNFVISSTANLNEDLLNEIKSRGLIGNADGEPYIVMGQWKVRINFPGEGCKLIPCEAVAAV